MTEEPGITREEFCSRFKAHMLSRAGTTCADADMDYWGEY